MILYEESAGVGLITLNDPDRLNAMGEEMAAAFKARIEKMRGDPPRVVILTGAGRAFSAGGDLQMLRQKHRFSVEENRQIMLDFYASFLGMLELEVPLVAAINGHAVGAGLCLACACDLRIADPAAKFSAPFTRLGLFPGMGASHFIPRVLGPSQARDLLLSGRRLVAEEALAIGLVSRLSEPQGILELARSMATEIADSGPEATRGLLLSLRGSSQDLQRSLEREAQAQAESYASQEFQEGLQRALKRVG